jgi:hypothetical protein
MGGVRGFGIFVGAEVADHGAEGKKSARGQGGTVKEL